MKRFFKVLFPFLFKTRFNLKDSDYEVIEAFASEGETYWMFANEQKVPVERAMAALDIYAEVEQKLDKEYLETLFASVIESCRKGDLVEVASMIKFAEQRMKHITNIDLMYKLASVLYFDKNENIYSYDYEYNEKKILRWKKAEDIESFFLKMPINDLLPSFSGSSLNLATYTKVQRSELISQLRNHLLILSDDKRNKDLVTKLQSRVTILESLLNSES